MEMINEQDKNIKYIIKFHLALLLLAFSFNLLNYSAGMFTASLLGVPFGTTTNNGTTYYVDIVNGNDTKCNGLSPNTYGGSSTTNQACPFKTIQYALGTYTKAGKINLKCGDIVNVAPGDYTINTSNEARTKIKFQIKPENNICTDINPITIKSNPSNGVYAKTNGFVINQINGIVIDGFEIIIPQPKTLAEANSWDLNWNSMPYAPGIYALRGSNHITIKNNYIHNTLADGIFISTDSSNSQITNNKISYTASSGIQAYGNNAVIKNNEISRVLQHPLCFLQDKKYIFAGAPDADGMSIHGQNIQISGNKISDIRSIDGIAGLANACIINGTPPTRLPHSDGIQIMTSNNIPNKNITIEKNIIDFSNYYTGATWCLPPNFITPPSPHYSDGNTPASCSVQGIFIVTCKSTALCDAGEATIANRVTNVVIKNNIVKSLTPVSIGYANDVKILNNTIISLFPTIAVKSPITINRDSNRAVIKNNIIYGIYSSSYSYLYIDTTDSDGSVSNNLYYQTNRYANSIADVPVTSPLSLFVDKDNNYHLKDLSPAISKGTDLSSLIVIDDKDNTKRYAPFDIGAYSYAYTLSKPTSLSATNDKDVSKITLTWSTVNNASGYNIYRSESSSGPYVKIDTVNNINTYVSTNLKENTTYYYQVSAYNGGSESPKSDQKSATTVILNAPTVDKTTASGKEITVSWKDNSSRETGYYVYRSKTKNGTYTWTNNTLPKDAQSYTDKDTALTAGETYYYKVKAFYKNNSDGTKTYSNYSNDGSATIAPPTSTPTGLSATSDKNTSKITLSWAAVTGISNYNIYRSKNSDNGYENIGTATTNSYTDGNADEDTTYYYKISALGDGGESRQSSAISQKTVVTVPTNFTAVAQPGKEILLSWQNNSKIATGLVIYYLDGANITQINRIPMGNSYTDTNLTPGKSYSYVIKSYYKNSNGVVVVSGRSTTAKATAKE